jgi:hypothetical protein
MSKAQGMRRRLNVSIGLGVRIEYEMIVFTHFISCGMSMTRVRQD